MTILIERGNDSFLGGSDRLDVKYHRNKNASAWNRKKGDQNHDHYQAIRAYSSSYYNVNC